MAFSALRLDSRDMMPPGRIASTANANLCSTLGFNVDADAPSEFFEQTFIWVRLILCTTFSVMLVTEPVRPHGSVVQTRPGYSGRARNGDAS
ncbi:hypothetical protein [Lysobacter sp. F6437]|uniref:hypothetical protein n=1 Tax=Lysobacter sp. F6437 TaxID=3459296 RepID=UPI00403E21A6